MILNQIEHSLDFTMHIILKRHIQIQPEAILLIQQTLEELTHKLLPCIHRLEDNLKHIAG